MHEITTFACKVVRTSGTYGWNNCQDILAISLMHVPKQKLIEVDRQTNMLLLSQPQTGQPQNAFPCISFMLLHRSLVLKIAWIFGKNRWSTYKTKQKTLYKQKTLISQANKSFFFSYRFVFLWVLKYLGSRNGP